MILVYAGIVPSKPGAVSPELEDLRIRSKLLIYQLAAKNDIVFLPTIAVAELLVPVPSAQKGPLIAALAERFFCSPFDLPAAAIASDLWAKHHQLPADLQYESRNVLKADAMIVGCARAAGATDFYSHDKRCRGLANLVMAAHDLPASDPNDMFLVNEIKNGNLPPLPPPNKPKMERRKRNDLSEPGDQEE
jgi:hypothetical protein